MAEFDRDFLRRCAGVADLVGRRDIWTVFNRANWIDVMGLGLPPERYDFGGISGGPMLSVIERHGLRSWALAGVIYEGPNPSTEEGAKRLKASRRSKRAGRISYDRTGPSI